MKVKALILIDHHGIKKVGDIFDVSDRSGNELIRRGLAVLCEDTPAEEVKPKSKGKK